MKIEYRAFPKIRPDEIQGILDENGTEGWRLHTCNPVALGDTIYLTVVFDRQIVTEEAPPAKAKPEIAADGTPIHRRTIGNLEAMPMKS